MPSVRKVNEVKREAADSELCSPEPMERKKPKGKRKEHEFHELNEFIRNYE